MTGECCKGCRFFLLSVESTEEGDGYCRRYPPSIVHAVVGEFPEVHGSDWCGEWQASSERLMEEK
jgi:hypothetical protein